MRRLITSLSVPALLMVAQSCAAQVLNVPSPDESPPPAPTLPLAVQNMLERAVAKGERETVKAVVDIAKQTNPDFVDEIEVVWMEFQNTQKRLESRRLRREERAIRNAGIFELWTGKAEFGASQTSGNNDSVGLTAAVNIQREGIDWTHKIDGRLDFRTNNGNTQREQFRLAYEPNYQINERLFVFALGQFERDRLQGFAARYSLSGGVGYKIIDRDTIALSSKIGPALRFSQRTDGTDDLRFAGLLGFDFDWQLAERLKFTQDANAVAETGASAVIFVDSSNTSIDLVSGLEAGITERLTTRLSWTLEYDSNPPPGGVTTDTLSRFTLIYGF